MSIDIYIPTGTNEVIAQLLDKQVSNIINQRYFHNIDSIIGIPIEAEILYRIYGFLLNLMAVSMALSIVDLLSFAGNYLITP